jgi:hypothetical protein
MSVKSQVRTEVAADDVRPSQLTVHLWLLVDMELPMMCNSFAYSEEKVK